MNFCRKKRQFFCFPAGRRKELCFIGVKRSSGFPPRHHFGGKPWNHRAPGLKATARRGCLHLPADGAGSRRPLGSRAGELHGHCGGRGPGASALEKTSKHRQIRLMVREVWLVLDEIVYMYIVMFSHRFGGKPV